MRWPGFTPLSLCNWDRRMDLGRERGCPNAEMPRMERECCRKSPASPANAMGTLCSVLKVGDFAANVKISCWARSEIRNQTVWTHFWQYQTATPLSASCSADSAKTYKTAPKSEYWDSGPHPNKVWTLSETWFFTTQYLDSPTSQQELLEL